MAKKYLFCCPKREHGLESPLGLRPHGDEFGHAPAQSECSPFQRKGHHFFVSLYVIKEVKVKRKAKAIPEGP
jgi:hypothetical protein